MVAGRRGPRPDAASRRAALRLERCPWRHAAVTASVIQNSPLASRVVRDFQRARGRGDDIAARGANMAGQSRASSACATASSRASFRPASIALCGRASRIGKDGENRCNGSLRALAAPTRRPASMRSPFMAAVRARSLRHSAIAASSPSRSKLLESPSEVRDGAHLVTAAKGDLSQAFERAGVVVVVSRAFEARQ